MVCNEENNIKNNNYELMTIKWIELSDEMKKIIEEVLIVAPWRELHLNSDTRIKRREK